MLYEELLKEDTQAVVALMRGFNRWIEEDWGFDYKEKFCCPYISLMDLEAAVAELEWCLEKGARTIVMRPAPVWTESGQLSPGTTQSLTPSGQGLTKLE